MKKLTKMSKYFLDTEFHEYFKQPMLHKFKIGKPIPTIDLISIGIVSEDGREYYAVCKEFNIEDAWYSSQPSTDPDNKYWLRHNVLIPLLHELTNRAIKDPHIDYDLLQAYPDIKQLNALVHLYGKTKAKITKELIDFCIPFEYKLDTSFYCTESMLKEAKARLAKGEVVKQTRYYTMDSKAEMYGYFCDYDWVVIAQLFGRMIDLPDTFPMYCIDLKQTMDEKALLLTDFKSIKSHPKYPKQMHEHNALADAKWNYELYKFLQTIK